MTTEEKLRILDEIEDQIKSGLDIDGLRKAHLRVYTIPVYFETSYEVRAKKAILLARIEDYLEKEIENEKQR